jgi:pimeloyl-ACP methyl ester carboxylesterase
VVTTSASGGRGASPGRRSPGTPRTRRTALKVGLGGLLGVTGAGAVGAELVNHGVLPGKGFLDRLDGACVVPAPRLSFGAVGPSFSGSFYSAARHQTVGVTLAYPPGHGPGSELPLIVALHAYGGNHDKVLTGMSLAQAVALRPDLRGVPGGRPSGPALSPLPPMAIVAADGGGGYWNPHPGDDPLGMIVDELIPRCQRKGLGRGSRKIGTLGISMGGYGAILVAEKYPELIGAAAAIGPAIWTSYAQAQEVNPGAYASAAAFAAGDAVTHARTLASVPVRVASGSDDPFHPGVEALVKVLPAHAVVDISGGCHTAPFFLAQEPPSLAFLGEHLAGR